MSLMGLGGHSKADCGDQLRTLYREGPVLSNTDTQGQHVRFYLV
jgi:hypothetical protein